MNLEDMLTRGYFPAEVPPIFSTANFASIAPKISSPIPKKTWVKPVALNLARPGSLRRRLGIPNPFAQLNLVEQCRAEWPTIEKHLTKSKISLSRPVPTSASKARALAFQSPIAARSAERLSRMWRGRFTVRADINDFYGSIYTHSLEWALHTKAVAKANVRSRQPLLGKIIDEAVRNGQDGQTKGIPVGPDTSLLLAEVILCEIDAQISARIPSTVSSAIRLVDDIEFFAVSRAEAEDFLTEWDSLLHSYDLSLNPKKTAIFEGPVPHEASWAVRLRQFVLRTTSDVVLARDITSFFACAFELSRQFPDDAVLSYAISKTSSLPVEKESWQALQYALLASITAEPSTLRFASPILGSSLVGGRDLDFVLIEGTLNDMCRHHAPFEHGSEVAWSLHILRMMGLSLETSAAEKVAKMQDNSSLILLFDFIERGSIKGVLPDTSSALSRASDPSVHLSEDWLLGYEASRNAWVPPGSFGTEAHWNELLKANIAFFRSTGLTKKNETFKNSSAAPNFVHSKNITIPKPAPPKTSTLSKSAAPKTSAKPSLMPAKTGSPKSVFLPPPTLSPSANLNKGPLPRKPVANPWIDASDYSASPVNFY